MHSRKSERGERATAAEQLPKDRNWGKRHGWSRKRWEIRDPADYGSGVKRVWNGSDVRQIKIGKVMPCDGNHKQHDCAAFGASPEENSGPWPRFAHLLPPSRKKSGEHRIDENKSRLK